MPGVVLANATDQRIQVIVTGAASSATTLTLAPREERVTSWFYPERESDTRTVTVKATDASGLTIFCKTFGWKAIHELTFRIEIQANVLAC